ncbi:GH16643 [Drosophila grimshawi]|uniref:GH16643 n=1 Tax=Drosophila grimshawi TaxID=7222 RepID=B4J2L5_DROGR|nr:GH16643 [Drosophila grimshawi]
MEVLAVQSNYGGVLGSNKVRDWTSTLTPPTSSAVAAKKVAVAVGSSSSNINNNSSSRSQTNTHSIKHKQPTTSSSSSSISKKTKSSNNNSTNSNSNFVNNRYPIAISYDEQDDEELSLCIDVDASAVNALSLRLLDQLREAKARHLTCTEVSLPCDLTPSIAAEIIKEPCGIRGCTIYVEFEDEPQNSRRIASLKVDPDTVSTFEVYLTLRQDHRGWAALLPQFMKSLARTITISPEYTITKHKLYSADGLGARRSYSFGSSSSTSSSSSSSQAIATPTL